MIERPALRPRVWRTLAVAAALALGLGGALVAAAPASAAGVFTVTTNLDDGLPGSLSYALANLDPVGGNTITITTPGPIVVPTALPIIFHDVVILGPPGGVTITTTPSARSFMFLNSTVTMQDINVVPDVAGSSNGIQATNSDLTLVRVSVSDFDSGVVVSDASLSATSVTLTDNSNGGLYFSGSLATDSATLSDVVAGGHAGSPVGTGVTIYSTGGLVSLTDVTTVYTATWGMVVQNIGGTIAMDTVTVEDAGVGMDVTGSHGTVLTAQHIVANRTAHGFIARLDDSELDASDIRATDSANNGVNIFATNGSRATVVSASASAGTVRGIVVDATDSSIRLQDPTADHNGISASVCGCSAGSGIKITAHNSTVAVDGADVHDNTGYFAAGGIDVTEATDASTVTISNSTITQNHSLDDGGGIRVDLMADDGTTVTISDSTISGNDSVDGGGGIFLHRIGNGAQSTAKVAIVRTTVDDNTAGGYGAGIAIEDPEGETSGLPTVLIDSSTLSHNTTVAGGGGLYVTKFSGSPSVVKLLNSTVSANLAQLGGGVHVEVGGGGGGGGAQLTTIISGTTIMENVAHTSGGIETGGGGVNSALQIENSIVAGSTSDTLDPNINDLQLQSGAPFTMTYSLVEKPDAAVVVPTGVGNLTGVSPQLGPLANNGGATKTHLVAPGSPAYNAGDPAFVGIGLFDQRGQARVYDRVDMGAVEWQPALAHTGAELTPRPPLVAFLLLLIGVAMVAFSRLQTARSLS